MCVCVFIYLCVCVYTHTHRYLSRNIATYLLTHMSINIHLCARAHVCEDEQALVCLSNREIVDASSGRIFHCKIAKNRVFL